MADPPASDAALDAALDAVVSIDGKGRVVEFNRAAERMFGYERAEAMSREVADLIIPERHRAAHWDCLHRVVEGGRSRFLDDRVELAALRAGGGEFPVELAVTRTGDDPPRFTAWIRDLSESKAAEAEAARRNTLMQRAELVAGIGSWEWRPERGELLWSDNCFRIFGLRPGETTPSIDLFLSAIHPDDRDSMERALAALRHHGVFPPLEYRIVRPDGTIHHLRSTMAVAGKGEDGTPFILGSVQDLTALYRVEREIKARLAVSEALERWESFDRGAQRLLSDLGAVMSADVGALWVRERDGLVARAFWQADGRDVGEFKAATMALRFQRGSGLIGRVWETMQPQVLADLLDHELYRRRTAAELAGLHGAIAFPAVDGDELMAVVEFYSRDEADANAHLLRTLNGIGRELGQFLSHRRGELSRTSLTPRELEILQLAAHGYSGRRIAEELVVSPATVKTHFENIYAKLEVSDRAAAVAEGLRLGLIQ